MIVDSIENSFENQRIKRSLDQVNQSGWIILAISLLIDLLLTLLVQDSLPSYGTARIGILLVFMLFSWSLTQIKYNRVRAFITFFSIYITFFIYPILPIANQPQEDIFLLFMVYMVIIVLPIIIYPRSKTHIIISWQVLLTITFILSTIRVLSKLKDNGYTQITRVFTDEPMIPLAYFAVVAFFIYFIYYLHNKNLNQQEMILRANNDLNKKLNLISEQKETLKTQKEELLQIHEELETIKEHLERKVKRRRSQLREQQRELSQFGFMNSHLLRAPISRLKGLLHINILIPEQDERIKILGMVKNTLAELDTTSNSINEVLNKKNPNKLIEIEQRIAQIYGEDTKYPQE